MTLYLHFSGTGIASVYVGQKDYRISGNFQGIYISRISLVQAQFVKYKILKYFASITKIWSPAAIREIKILEMENEGLFVKYATLEVKMFIAIAATRSNIENRLTCTGV